MSSRICCVSNKVLWQQRFIWRVLPAFPPSALLFISPREFETGWMLKLPPPLLLAGNEKVLLCFTKAVKHSFLHTLYVLYKNLHWTDKKKMLAECAVIKITKTKKTMMVTLAIYLILKSLNAQEEMQTSHTLGFIDHYRERPMCCTPESPWTCLWPGLPFIQLGSCDITGSTSLGQVLPLYSLVSWSEEDSTKTTYKK